jgi:hypothetical protein
MKVMAPEMKVIFTRICGPASSKTLNDCAYRTTGWLKWSYTSVTVDKGGQRVKLSTEPHVFPMSNMCLHLTSHRVWHIAETNRKPVPASKFCFQRHLVLPPKSSPCRVYTYGFSVVLYLV